MIEVRPFRWMLPVLLAGCAMPGRGGVQPVSAVQTPADRFGPLFEAVQMRRIFPDGKTFVDAVPKRPDAVILAAYRSGDFADDATFRAFVLANFDVPGLAPPPARPTARACRSTGISANCGRI